MATIFIRGGQAGLRLPLSNLPNQKTHHLGELFDGGTANTLRELFEYLTANAKSVFALNKNIGALVNASGLYAEEEIKISL